MDGAEWKGRQGLFATGHINTHADSGGSCSQIHYCKVVCLLYLYILERKRGSSHGLDLTPHTGFTLYLLCYLVYVSQLPMDILGQVTKQGDRTLM